MVYKVSLTHPVLFSSLFPAFFKLFKYSKSPPVHNLCTSHSLSWNCPFPPFSLAWVFPIIQSSSATSSKSLHLTTWYKWWLSFLTAEDCHTMAFFLFTFQIYCLPLLTPSLHKKRELMYLIHLHIPNALELCLAHSQCSINMSWLNKFIIYFDTPNTSHPADFKRGAE